MLNFNKIAITLRAIRQLGIRPLLNYALYQGGLHSGYFQYKTPTIVTKNYSFPSIENINCIFPLPDSHNLNTILQDKRGTLITEAQEIVAGNMHLFGNQSVPINLKPMGTLQHWTAYELRKANLGIEDIKFIWEPARFGWSYTLGRAFLLTNRDSYAQSFWQLFKKFEELNPVNLGQNWISGQEVALRLMAMTFAACVFKNAQCTSEHKFQDLIQAIVHHAKRIPPTVFYAKAQNNNHLLTEAAALFTAGIFLKGYSEAKHWHKLGWKWFNRAINLQISDDGTYIQHSMNYHRLMLHTALWMQMIAKTIGDTLPANALEKLTFATQWLLAQIDPISGSAPNLGHNDGALILPLATAKFPDYRPVAQAASRAFLRKAFLPAGPWDELSLWLGLHSINTPAKFQKRPSSPAVLRLGNNKSWATLRVINFTDRPAHADQLHVDLWFKGFNVACDPGTYRYNASAPWDNALASTLVHNTIIIDKKDQMQRAGRFLWLDWAQARVLKHTNKEIIAEHNGYRKIHILHRRSLKQSTQSTWVIEDRLLPQYHLTAKHEFSIHWLLPDWEWEIIGNTLQFKTPFGKLKTEINWKLLYKHTEKLTLTLRLIRSGKALIGPQPEKPIFGWFSPTYGKIIPALSIRQTATLQPPIAIISKWTFLDN